MDLEIRLFVIDDSAVMRQMITKIVEKDKHIRIVGRARNGREAIDRIVQLKPDVVTLDVEMPLMDGLETLEKIMQIYPVPGDVSAVNKGRPYDSKALNCAQIYPQAANQEELQLLNCLLYNCSHSTRAAALTEALFFGTFLNWPFAPEASDWALGHRRSVPLPRMSF